MSEPSTFEHYASNFGRDTFRILFVKASADKAAEAYAKVTGHDIHRNISVSSSADTSYPPTGGVVQLADSEWSIIFHSIGHNVGCHRDVDASVMAHSLEADVLVFVADDKIDYIGCNYIVPGKPLIHFFTQSDSKTQLEFYEVFGEEPPPYKIVNSYADLFNSFGISTAQLYCNEDQSVVVADAEDVNRIAAFHFVSESPQT